MTDWVPESFFRHGLACVGRMRERAAPPDRFSPVMPDEPTWTWRPYEPCSERALAALLHECGILTDSAEIEQYIAHVRELDRRTTARLCS